MPLSVHQAVGVEGSSGDEEDRLRHQPLGQALVNDLVPTAHHRIIAPRAIFVGPAVEPLVLAVTSPVCPSMPRFSPSRTRSVWALGKIVRGGTCQCFDQPRLSCSRTAGRSRRRGSGGCSTPRVIEGVRGSGGDHWRHWLLPVYYTHLTLP